MDFLRQKDKKLQYFFFKIKSLEYFNDDVVQLRRVQQRAGHEPGAPSAAFRTRSGHTREDRKVHYRNGARYQSGGSNYQMVKNWLLYQVASR